MEGAFENLPAWALFGLGVLWLTFQFVQKFLEKQTEKRDERARLEYRKKRHEERLTNHSLGGGASVQPAPSRPSEDTGRHDLRALYAEEREREQRLEILGNTRAHADLMRRLVEAETGQAALMQRVVAMQEQQGKTLESVAETQKAIVRFLTRPNAPEPAPGATLRDIEAGGNP